MKIKSLLLIVLVAAYAEVTCAQDSGRNGFFLGASFMGEAWTLQDLDVDAESGAGFGLKFGYLFQPAFAVYTILDGAEINPSVGETYTLSHFDIGAEGRLTTLSSIFVPYAKLSVGAMLVMQDDPDGDLEVSGGGFGLGAGAYLFITEKLAFDIHLTKSWINVDEVSVGPITVEVDENAETGRFGIGLVYHF